MVANLLLASALTFAPIKAQNSEVVETPIVETTDKQEINLEEFVANLTQKYSQMETWLAILFGTNGGVSIVSILVALGISIKNKKNAKATEKAVLDVINKNLGTAYEKLTKENIDEIIRQQDITKDLMKLMIKAFAFAQDKSAEGKKALLDLMIEINTLNGNDKEVARQLTEQKEEIVKTEVKIANTNKKVESDYIPVD